MRALLIAVLLLACPIVAVAEVGYYRFPTLRGDTIVFTAEGDLWRVAATGGTAQRLTTHPGQETHPEISPDGTTVAFSADYEGATEVYVMPIAGGLPRRLTFEGDEARVIGWTPMGEILYATEHFSTLPSEHLVRLDPETGQSRVIPLARVSGGVFEPAGETLFFTRFRAQTSFAKRYKGGTAQSLWRFTTGDAEARPLTADFPGTSFEPMWWSGRLVFATDRDGTMNLWSMAPTGEDLRQHSHHAGWDVKDPAIDRGWVVYQLGADLHLLDLASGEDRRLDIVLSSDFDQRRPRWIDEPFEYLTSAHLSPRGDRVVLTARGQVFVTPSRSGRLVEASRRPGVRYRSARFLPGQEAKASSLIVFSDESGEVEAWRLDARGLDAAEQLTDDGTILRFDGLPSPDGRLYAYVDKNNELWLLELESRRQTAVASNVDPELSSLSWSPDSRWLAYGRYADNFLTQLFVYSVEGASSSPLTSDRFDSFSPVWSGDGQWIYFLSNRNLDSVTRHPWGSYAPAPFLDRMTKIYHLPLHRGTRSPFAPISELDPEDEAAPEKKLASGPPEVVIDDLANLPRRLQEVPVEPGNYTALGVTEERLFWLAASTAVEPELSLMTLELSRQRPEPKTLRRGIERYEVSGDGGKLLLQQAGSLYVVEAGGMMPDEVSDAKVPLDGWSFLLDPREEWRQMFVDAWRLHRDYFYDPGMHGVDWAAMRDKYLPLVERVTDRAELSDLFGQLIGELSALHARVRDGEFRRGDDDIEPASLGAILVRDEAVGGHRVETIYATDPDLPSESSPLSRPGTDVREGDVILTINGTPTLAVTDPGELLRNQAGKQVLLTVKDGQTASVRETVAWPITPEEAAELRYDAWEYERRQQVEALGGVDIGYVHLRAMGPGSYTEWARHFFPVFHRRGLIIDARDNRGGNIDSWILGSLIRKPWMWWKPRVGPVYSNMQFAFGGHMVVLVNERTSSDGEAFAEGFRRLGLGKLIGNRTWGGEIWLTSSNVLVDKGIATAAEFGVYGPEGEWLIEGHGVEPDVVVENLPHATFNGEDDQLEAAVEHLQRLIVEDPPVVPEAPPYPDKSFPGGG